LPIDLDLFRDCPRQKESGRFTGRRALRAPGTTGLAADATPGYDGRVRLPTRWILWGASGANQGRPGKMDAASHKLIEELGRELVGVAEKLESVRERLESAEISLPASEEEFDADISHILPVSTLMELCEASCHKIRLLTYENYFRINSV